MIASTVSIHNDRLWLVWVGAVFVYLLLAMAALLRHERNLVSLITLSGMVALSPMFIDWHPDFWWLPFWFAVAVAEGIGLRNAIQRRQRNPKETAGP